MADLPRSCSIAALPATHLLQLLNCTTSERDIGFHMLAKPEKRGGRRNRVCMCQADQAAACCQYQCASLTPFAHTPLPSHHPPILLLWPVTTSVWEGKAPNFAGATAPNAIVQWVPDHIRSGCRNDHHIMSWSSNLTGTAGHLLTYTPADLHSSQSDTKYSTKNKPRALKQHQPRLSDAVNTSQHTLSLSHHSASPSAVAVRALLAFTAAALPLPWWARRVPPTQWPLVAAAAIPLPWRTRRVPATLAP
jgi:hypothetical protein